MEKATGTLSRNRNRRARMPTKPVVSGLISHHSYYRTEQALCEHQTHGHGGQCCGVGKRRNGDLDRRRLLSASLEVIPMAEQTPDDEHEQTQAEQLHHAVDQALRTPGQQHDEEFDADVPVVHEGRCGCKGYADELRQHHHVERSGYRETKELGAQDVDARQHHHEEQGAEADPFSPAAYGFIESLELLQHARFSGLLTLSEKHALRPPTDRREKSGAELKQASPCPTIEDQAGACPSRLLDLGLKPKPGRTGGGSNLVLHLFIGPVFDSLLHIGNPAFDFGLFVPFAYHRLDVIVQDGFHRLLPSCSLLFGEFEILHPLVLGVILAVKVYFIPHQGKSLLIFPAHRVHERFKIRRQPVVTFPVHDQEEGKRSANLPAYGHILRDLHKSERLEGFIRTPDGLVDPFSNGIVDFHHRGGGGGPAERLDDVARNSGGPDGQTLHVFQLCHRPLGNNHAGAVSVDGEHFHAAKFLRFEFLVEVVCHVGADPAGGYTQRQSHPLADGHPPGG